MSGIRADLATWKPERFQTRLSWYRNGAVLTVFSIPQRNRSEKKSCPADKGESCADQHRDARAGGDHRKRWALINPD
jgi:hypothetical protein